MSDLSDLKEKAVSSKGLTGRIHSNQSYARNDFGLWVSSLLSRLHFSSVLDICCGTGNQLVLYAAMHGVGRIIGIDISKGALDIAKERLDKIQAGDRVILKALKMEEMFLDQDLKDAQFDLISCFYGFYYSENVKKTLNDAIDHLRPNGTIVIAGPYGDNNASLFNLLQRHFKLPQLVLYSSTTFMEQEVYPLLAEKCKVEEMNFVNPVCFPTAQSVIDYWQASTFYFPEHKDAVAKDVKDYFLSSHKEFVIEKHVKAYMGRKTK